MTQRLGLLYGLSMTTTELLTAEQALADECAARGAILLVLAESRKREITKRRELVPA